MRRAALSFFRFASSAALVGLVGIPRCARTNDAHAPREGPPPVAARGAIETVDVPGDERVLVVEGSARVQRPIVHLHGMCADPRSDLDAWGAAAREHGTVIALVGDVPCPDKPGTTKWTDDVEAIDARVVAAVGAVGVARARSLDDAEILVVGSSMGAARAEALAKKNPSRYRRLVLVGSPRTPSPANLEGASAVATLAGEREPQQMMRSGARLLSEAGTPARFWELPGASHGEYGAEGARIMSDAIAFVATR
ncbi:MAG: hypothetical protein KF819_00405 [Labilithrix sp.]|nr:hypothetical protein [Labilithrix sp.]